MVFIPESEDFFVFSTIAFKAFQRGQTKYFLKKKILFHEDLIKMLSLISLFLRFPLYFPQNSGQQKYMAYLFKLSSRLIVERLLPTIASDAYIMGFVEETRTTRGQYCGCICGTRDHIFNIHSVQLSYSCLELRLDRI